MGGAGGRRRRSPGRTPPSVAYAAAAVPRGRADRVADAADGRALGWRPVLITGAAGGVGRFAVQLAHRAGVHVTAVVGRPARGVGLAELGADVVSVGRPAGSGPFDFVLESVGGRSLGESIRLVAAGGLVVVIGVSEDGPTTLSGPFLRRHGTRLPSYLIFSDLAATAAGGPT